MVLTFYWDSLKNCISNSKEDNRFVKWTVIYFTQFTYQDTPTTAAIFALAEMYFLNGVN